MTSHTEKRSFDPSEAERKTPEQRFAVDLATKDKYEERKHWLKKTLERYPEMVWDEGVNLEALQ